MSPETQIARQPVVVIDIGSSAIRMILAEVGPKSEIRYLENLQKPVSFGKDVFTTGRISTQAIRQGIEILSNFKTVMDQYGVKTYHAIATSAVRDASNRENFVDQVFVRTGIDVEVVEGAEENRLDLIAVEHSLQGRFDFEKLNCLILEVGSGSTELIILNKGEIELTRTLALGSIRLPEQAVAGKTDSDSMQRILKRSIHNIAVQAAKECSLGDIDHFVALGGDMRFVARQLQEDDQDQFSIIQNKSFLNFVDSLAKLSADEIVTKYGIPYTDAETLYTSLLIYANFLKETRAEKLIVPKASMREALLLELSQMFSGYKRTDLSKQVVNSAKKLGKKFQFDEPHASCVAALSVKLFDALDEHHHLGSRERLLLEVSALLHDIGMFVSASSHHKHSSYLVDASEIFGLRRTDKDIVSNVVRYHRRSPPQVSHVAYMSLAKQDRATTSKLAAILRAADSLDRSHQQKIRAFSIEEKADSIVIWVSEDVGDISLERDGLSRKGMMFAEVFGKAIVLKQGKSPQ